MCAQVQQKGGRGALAGQQHAHMLPVNSPSAYLLGQKAAPHGANGGPRSVIPPVFALV
jgi:hypothetical protein